MIRAGEYPAPIFFKGLSVKEYASILNRRLWIISLLFAIDYKFTTSAEMFGYRPQKNFKKINFLGFFY